MSFWPDTAGRLGRGMTLEVCTKVKVKLKLRREKCNPPDSIGPQRGPSPLNNEGYGTP
jgi:hypothetical protein